MVLEIETNLRNKPTPASGRQRGQRRILNTPNKTVTTITGKTTNQREFIQISIGSTYIRRNFLFHISKQISKTQGRKSHHRALIAEELFVTLIVEL